MHMQVYASNIVCLICRYLTISSRSLAQGRHMRVGPMTVTIPAAGPKKPPFQVSG